MYPFIIEPKTVPLIWGGDALVRRFGKSGDAQASIGESWECWDENRVRNGAYAGATIGQLRARLGQALMGSLDASRIFPVLTKLIDARQALSVQVHPDDAYAQRVEGKPWGKTECWYVLEARPEAEIVLGWNRDTSREEYLERVRDGSLGELLRRVPARTGDVFYLPAGTLHAIGAGIILFEVQQASDLTYRIFDWNRVGPDGKPRQLHVEKAADVLDFSAARNAAVRPLVYERDGVERTLLVADSYFVLERVACGPIPVRLETEGVPLIVQALGGGLEMRWGGAQTLAVPAYATALVPAALSSLEVIGSEEGTAMLLAFPMTGDLLVGLLERVGR